MAVNLSVFLRWAGGALLLASAGLNMWQYREGAKTVAAFEQLRREVAARNPAVTAVRSASDTRREPPVPPVRIGGDPGALAQPVATEPLTRAAAGGPASPAIAAANQAIGNYLGEPVAPPANLDPKYTAAGLTEAFRAWCAARGIKVQKLAIDTSEFPFLVYGQVDALPEVMRDIQSLPGYTYSGSVTGRTREGTYFSLNMMPSSAYPREQAEAIQRRLVIRLGMLGAIWTDPVP